MSHWEPWWLPSRSQRWRRTDNFPEWQTCGGLAWLGRWLTPLKREINRNMEEQHPWPHTHATQSILDLTGVLDLTDIVCLEDNLTGLVTLAKVHQEERGKEDTPSPLPLCSCCALVTEESFLTIPSRGILVILLLWWHLHGAEMDKCKNQLIFWSAAKQDWTHDHESLYFI